MNRLYNVEIGLSQGCNNLEFEFELCGLHCIQFQYVFKTHISNFPISSLRELSLRCCNIDDLAVKLLAEALKKDVPLQQLDLSHNNIGSEGACHLASSLRLNRTLLCLSLTNNKIDDVGAMALAEVCS